MVTEPFELFWVFEVVLSLVLGTTGTITVDCSSVDWDLLFTDSPLEVISEVVVLELLTSVEFSVLLPDVYEPFIEQSVFTPEPVDLYTIFPHSSVLCISIPFTSNLDVVSNDGCPYLLSFPTRITAFLGFTLSKKLWVVLVFDQ